MAAYRAALAGEKPQDQTKDDPRSLKWLLSQYRKSSSYLELSPATRRQRDNIFSHVLETSGSAPYSAIKRSHIVDGRERRAKTPSQAGNFLKAMRGLFKWALESQLVDVDPTDGVKGPKRTKTEGFAVWTDDDVAKYYASWPTGTKERVWIDVLLYTGLRRGDAALLGRQHIKDGIATIRTEKTGTEVNPDTRTTAPHTGGRAYWRHALHSRQHRQAPHQGELRQHVPRSVQRSGCAEVSARTTQDRGHKGGRGRCHGG
ncbi:MAG: hypothetical protein P8N72_04290 [Flavimaricola sp.]|nr:hypothetical protein [Flavimaricola sp.]